jgi:hypothetical protein
MLQAMGGGAIDVGGVGNAPPVFAAAGGEKIAIVAANQANPFGSALLVPKNSPITSVAQLTGAADGFNVMPAALPAGLEAFVEHVIPILRQRGAFRIEYTGRTLRDHYGLPRPENQFTAADDTRELAASGYGIRA